MATPLPELLTLLEERAPKLRKAGVLALELVEVGVKVQFAPDLSDLPPDPLASAGKKSASSSNPLFDATTYGLPPGSRLPGFESPDPDDDNAEEDEHGRPLGADLDED